MGNEGWWRGGAGGGRLVPACTEQLHYVTPTCLLLRNYASLPRLGWCGKQQVLPCRRDAGKN